MDKWVQGYACAVATIVRSHGLNTEHREALEAAGLTSIEELRKYGVDDHDIEILKPVIDEIQSKKNRKRPFRSRREVQAQ